MRILMLTWEFPPLMTGGLSMACYGVARALLKMGIEIELIIPTREEAYFPLRKEEDVDALPVDFVDPQKRKKWGEKVKAKEIIGEIEPFVTAYETTGEKIRPGILEKEIFAYTEKIASTEKTEFLSFILQSLNGDHFLFREVKNYCLKAVKIARKLDFDAIHAHDWLTSPAAVVIKELSKKPLVVHIHSTEFDRAGGPGEKRIHDAEYIATHLADRVITVSHYTANMVMERYKVDPQKVRIVHNAFTLSNGAKEKKRIFREPTALFLGRITIQKGPDYFLEVARRVLQKEKNVRFVMGGRGDMEKPILHKAASLGLGTKFLFAGFLKREDVEELLSAADIFIMPSVSEPFGIAPLEAMSYGAVAIVSKQSGVAEIIKHAYKVDFWDIDEIVSIILDLVKNSQKLREISAQSREDVAAIEWEAAAGKIIDIYRELKGS